MKKITLPSILFLLVIGFYSCKDDCMDRTNPDCSNYDPCWNHTPAKADFGIYEKVGWYESETDTILQKNGVVFKPKSTQDKVTWILGAETLTQEELFRINFPNGWIEVTMIAEVDSSDCLARQELKDTLTKRFYVLKYRSDSNILRQIPWWGTWEGYNTDAPDELFTISWGFINQYQRASFDFVGLPKGLKKQRPFYSISSSECSGIYVYTGYRSILINDDGIHQDWGGFALNGLCKREGKNVTIEYRYNNTPYQTWMKGEKLKIEPIEWVKKTYVGKKISNKVVTQ